MSGSHIRWARHEADAEDPERFAIRDALAFGKAVYDRRVALGLSVAELAQRTGMTADEIECIEEGGTEPTVSLLRRLAAALDADVRLTGSHPARGRAHRPGLGTGWLIAEPLHRRARQEPPLWRASAFGRGPLS